ncbi:PREDICTED: juvenile hormone-binding protein-like [Wasmannia auropunctata]|uniref:juvenile hormone-binding protein-like n=1 Tax=Wasmannia auropunctata TaxID=64793 RepID=UPI0005EE8631|nr:PREDICTED: juvenile hormone-binding protein-like [Wasmannia auropunctata]
MLAAAFAFVLITTHVTAEVPSYINICGRKDPNLDQCILNNIENLKDKICEGIPELDIRSTNPLLLDQLVIFDTPNTKLYIKDSKVTGLCDFTINSLHMDIDKLHFDVDLLFKQIQINSTYDLNLQLLVPIANKGQVYISTDNVGAKVGADIKVVTKNGQRYMYISKLTIKLDIKGYYIKLDQNQRELNQLREIVTNFVGNNQEEILRTFRPVLEKAISNEIISISNNIVKHFTYEELFPDRT